MSDSIRHFGIRHHGPGCAKSLVRALERQRPALVLIEGPAGAEEALRFLADAELVPPVALLSHDAEEPTYAVFHPFAEFSPEWQALLWARANGVAVRFIDVPIAVTLGWQREDRSPAAVATGDPESADVQTAVAPEAQTDGSTAEEAAAAEATPSDPTPRTFDGDPLDRLAEAAGYDDGEAWWNDQVEERGDDDGLFDAIATAMAALRDETPPRPAPRQFREDIREAHMRQAIRTAVKDGAARIAVVCGAWHVPALVMKVTAAADAKLLKGLPRRKTLSTWVPWTYPHLSRASGYGAGIAAPGWYEHLWRNGLSGGALAPGWLARVARLLREQDLDCSSAHLIEAVRLAETLAALRDRPAPGLAEIGEATRSILCNGDDAPMRLIAERLLVGDRIGAVPASVPTVPLQRDLAAEQKRLRLKPEALAKTLDLDLRNDTDRRRSHLLHRLAMLDIGWGEVRDVGHSARGSFHEIWSLAWQPSFEIDLIVASRYGATVAAAATARAVERARTAERLSDLATLIDRVLLAELPAAVPPVASELEARAATQGDPLALLAALPPLANIYRYGNVRQTDGAQVAHVFDGMLLRACVGLPLALCALDAAAAEKARELLLAVERAVGLRQGEEQLAAWRQALALAAASDASHPLTAGVATRLLLDAAIWDSGRVATRMERQLSRGSAPEQAAAWLDGFLNRNATVLLHGDLAWGLVDTWLSGIGDAHFLAVLPLLRRTFAGFEAADRRDLGERVKRPAGVAPKAVATTPAWNEARAARALPMLKELLGVADGD